jgi:alpha-tubulin suppressor-like RCC1 family protein
VRTRARRTSAVAATVTALAAGIALAVSSPAAALTPGQVTAWGDDGNGQLGDGQNVDHPSPVTTQGLSNVVQVAGGEAHSMALTAGGSVFAWGDNEFGDFGVVTPHPSMTTPVQVTGLSGVKQVATGFSDGLALLSNGTVMGWGSNSHGEVGDGTRTAHPTPVPVPGLGGVVAIAQRQQHSLALLANGTVMSWGQTTGADQLSPVAVPGLSGVTAIAAGSFHSLALLSNGTIMAWGSGGTGELGYGGANDQATPVAVSGITNATAIVAGSNFSLALLPNGTVEGFGTNQFNQLGSAPTTNQLVPIPVAGVSGATQVTAGDSFGAALLANGSVLAWGANAHGALGNGTVGATFSTVPTPAPVVGLRGAMAIAAGGAHTLAITPGGAAAPPPPVLGKSVDVTVVSGTVLVEPPPGTSLAAAFAPALSDPFAPATAAQSAGFVPLTQARQIPVGSELDTTRGVVALTSATTRSGGTQSGQFQAGVFQVLQARAQKGLTNLRLVDRSGVCAAAGKASVARKLSKRVTDLLRASAKGSFQTTGLYSAATARGTAWDTTDRCDGTLTVVHRGVVAVFDKRRHRTVVVRAGHRYLAKAA